MKYAVTLLTAGSALSWLAQRSGGPAWLLAWPAASLLLVGSAYLGLGPGVFGKRPDTGTLHPLAQLALGPFLAITWVLWRLLIALGENVSDPIAPRYHLGRRAREDELPDGIDLVVDMTCEFAAAPAGREGRTYWCLPTLDGSVPDDASFMDLAKRVAAWDGGGIYIHCAAGHGRSATLLAAALVLRGDAADLSEAVRMIKARRPLAGPNRGQRKFLERLFPAASPVDAA